MKPAEITPRVWTTLTAAHAARAAVRPQDGWSPAERAGFDIFEPLFRPDTVPVVFAQIGQSLDGRIATETGDARDISGAAGLAHLHRCRALSDAVVVGVRTAIQDDPRLTVRLVPGQNPARVVIDPDGRLPDSARVLADDGARRIVVQAVDRPRAVGIEVIRIPRSGPWMQAETIVAALAERGLRRILIEGGGITIARFLEAGLLWRLHVTIAPLIIGAGPSGVRTTPVTRLAEALRPEMRIYGLDDEVLFDCAIAHQGMQGCHAKVTPLHLSRRAASG